MLWLFLMDSFCRLANFEQPKERRAQCTLRSKRYGLRFRTAGEVSELPRDICEKTLMNLPDVPQGSPGLV